MSNEDMSPAERRKMLAESLRSGEAISVTPSGTVVTKQLGGGSSQDIVVPEGKLAVIN